MFPPCPRDILIYNEWPLKSRGYLSQLRQPQSEFLVVPCHLHVVSCLHAHQCIGVYTRSRFEHQCRSGSEGCLPFNVSFSPGYDIHVCCAGRLCSPPLYSISSLSRSSGRDGINPLSNVVMVRPFIMVRQFCYIAKRKHHVVFIVTKPGPETILVIHPYKVKPFLVSFQRPELKELLRSFF